MDQSRTYYRLNRVTTVDEDGSTRTFTFTSFDINLWSHSTAFTTTATGVLRNPGQNPENIGPLTQVWQEPNWCSSQWYSEGTVAFYSYGTGPNPTSTIITSAAIWSTQPTSLGSRYSNFISCQPYSQRNFFPGICPDQYSVAEVTQWYIEWATGGTETQWDATCCRSGMTIGSEYYRSCVSQFSTSTLVSAADFTSDMDDDASTAVIGAQPVQTIVSRGVAIADPISVAWRLSDMSILPSEYASSIVKRFGVSAMALSADSPRVSPPPAQQGPASSTPTSGTSSSRTSPRTIGIAVGVGVGALILIVGLVWFFLKRRQRRKQAAALESAIPEMEDQNKNYGAQFVNGKWINEAEVVEPKHEIDSRGLPMPPRSPQELDGVAITAEMPESGTPNSTRHLV